MYALVLQNNTQLGFFFFKKEDAEAIIAKVRTCCKHACSRLHIHHRDAQQK